MKTLHGGTKLAPRFANNAMPMGDDAVQPESVVTQLTFPASADTHDAASELAVLRRMMLGPVLEKQAELEQKIEDLTRRQSDPALRSQDCSEVLAQSLEHLHDKGRDLNQELESEIFAGVQKSFETDTDRMADLMYPILGPAVRKLVASLFQRSETESGQPYQVEQLFLIHKQTSILLSQAVLNEESARDADLVSGMLEAIRSFVTDAFSLHEFDGMNSIKLGDLTVWVEWGPKAVLAIVVRGFPDESVREHYGDVLQQIHREYASELESFDGDNGAFDSLDIARLSQHQPVPAKEPQVPRTWITLPRISLAAAVIFMFTVAGMVADKRQWNSMMTRLSAEPGVVVVNAQRHWGHDELTILVDPIAAPRDQVVRRAGIDSESVQIHWHSFQSQDKAIVQRRQLRERLYSGNHRVPRSAKQFSTSHTGRQE